MALNCPKCYNHEPTKVGQEVVDSYWKCEACGFEGSVEEFRIPMATLVVANFSHPLSPEANKKLMEMWNAAYFNGYPDEVCVTDVYDVKIAQQYKLGVDDMPLDQQVDDQIERLTLRVGGTLNDIDVVIPPALSYAAYIVSEHFGFVSPDLAIIAPVPDSIPTKYMPSQLLTA